MYSVKQEYSANERSITFTIQKKAHRIVVHTELLSIDFLAFPSSYTYIQGFIITLIHVSAQWYTLAALEKGGTEGERERDKP